MKRYRLFSTVIWHPRPLQAGGFVGERREIKAQKIFKAVDDRYTRLLIPQILNPHPKLPQTPRRTETADRLIEIDSSGNEVREIPLGED